MNSKETAEEIRDLTVEIEEASGGNMIGAINGIARMFQGWKLIGCGTDEGGRTYCDYSIPKPKP